MAGKRKGAAVAAQVRSIQLGDTLVLGIWMSSVTSLRLLSHLENGNDHSTSFVGQLQINQADAQGVRGTSSGLCES